MGRGGKVVCYTVEAAVAIGVGCFIGVLYVKGFIHHHMAKRKAAP